MGFPNTWSETCLITITPNGGADQPCYSITETVDIDIGDKDFDTIATLSGARLVKFTPQDVVTVTLEAYATEAATAGTSSGTTKTGFFDLMNTLVGATQPLTVVNDRGRGKYRIAILWTDKTGMTQATQKVDAANTALRVMVADGYFTSCKPSYTDGVLKWTIIFKAPPFDSSGNGNIHIESADSTTELPAVTAYSGTTKWHAA